MPDQLYPECPIEDFGPVGEWAYEKYRIIQPTFGEHYWVYKRVFHKGLEVFPEYVTDCLSWDAVEKIIDKAH